jgi:hypothetical protein
MISEQSFEGRDANLRHAERLLATYARQLEVLDGHRGKGQQQVTVKYVNVESGGQAVVGNVQSSSPSQSSRDQEPPALTDESGTALRMGQSRQKNGRGGGDGPQPSTEYRSDALKSKMRRQDTIRPTLHVSGCIRKKAARRQ